MWGGGGGGWGQEVVRSGGGGQVRVDCAPNRCEPIGVGGPVGGRVQCGCEPRIEVIVKMQKKVWGVQEVPVRTGVGGQVRGGCW